VSRAVIAPLAVVPAGVQRDDQPVPDRDDVIGTVVARAAEEPAEPRRSHHQDHLVTGGDDLLKLGSEPDLGLVAQRPLQLVAAAAGLRLRIRTGRVQVGPLQAWVHELHHARDITPVVGQEGIAYDPLVLVTHLGRLTTICPGQPSMSGRAGRPERPASITTIPAPLLHQSSRGATAPR
jgi:hypothetical protein